MYLRAAGVEGLEVGADVKEVEEAVTVEISNWVRVVESDQERGDIKEVQFAVAGDVCGAGEAEGVGEQDAYGI
jgi:hypothetical protein